MSSGNISEKTECAQYGKTNLLFVGRCHVDKGIEYLLEAVALLGDNVVLNIVGATDHDPNYYRKLTEIIQKRNIKEKVFFHGYVDDKNKLKQFHERADIFVLPSIIEGFGIVLLEAMSAGLPIVATNVGAIPELVKDGYNGILVPPRDMPSLAKAIDSLIRSPSMRRKYSINGFKYYQSVRDIHSWDNHLRTIRDIFNRLADAV